VNYCCSRSDIITTTTNITIATFYLSDIIILSISLFLIIIFYTGSAGPLVHCTVCTAYALTKLIPEFGKSHNHTMQMYDDNHMIVHIVIITIIYHHYDHY
jgi:polyferredoxin